METSVMQKIQKLLESFDPLDDKKCSNIFGEVSRIVDEASPKEAKDSLKAFIIKGLIDELILPLREIYKKLEHGT